MLTAKSFREELAKYASDLDAIQAQRFFKTDVGDYGEGDVFIGVRVPKTRKLVRKYAHIPCQEIAKLFVSPIHEHRHAAALLLAQQYKTSDDAEKKRIYELYRKALRSGAINNWDIVDSTCEYIVGEHLRASDRAELTLLAESRNLWERRVSIIATFAYIKKGDATTTLKIADILLHDSHDLIQKAVGWMLREVGKRVDEQMLRGFLDEHAHEMPRTMLRYAIERLPQVERQKYLRPASGQSVPR